MRRTTSRSPEAGAAAGEVEAPSGAARGLAGRGRRISAVDRVGALSGAAYVVLANLGGALIGEASGGGGSPGQQILDEQHRYAENPWTNVAFAVIILAQLALMTFVGYLCARVRDAGWFATTALVGGVAALIANFVSIAIVIALFVLRDELSPELARALQDVDGAGHLVQLLPFGVLVIFSSAAALVSRAFGRVLGWGGIVIGLTSIGGLIATGMPASDEFVIWPFLLVLLWITVISLRLGLARSRTATPMALAAAAGDSSPARARPVRPGGGPGRSGR